MTTEKHTPGPWQISREQGYPYIVAEQGKKWNNPTICSLYEDVTPEDSVTIGDWLKPFDNAETNARLIAAAPELLKSVDCADGNLGSWPDGSPILCENRRGARVMNHFAKAVDNLDAAVFSGDALFDADNRELFKNTLERWQRALTKWEEIAIEIDEEEK